MNELSKGSEKSKKRIASLQDDLTEYKDRNVKHKKKIKSLQENVKSLSDQLKEEKKKSRITIDKLMDDAEESMNKVHELTAELKTREKLGG